MSKIDKKIMWKRIIYTTKGTYYVNVPGADRRNSGLIEMISGLSPFSYIIWAPLHDLDDDGGIYYINQKISENIMKKRKKRISKWNRCFKPYGETKTC